MDFGYYVMALNVIIGVVMHLVERREVKKRERRHAEKYVKWEFSELMNMLLWRDPYGRE